ncbi:tetratricopeptide repeat protein [Magnetococcus sp. PR-3]|uniref:tetratricopeptide repeat protein n=1 Tax=Magnetococcus sp. PR-3 TaxID=3120355 RepID=UPI002FCE3687
MAQPSRIPLIPLALVLIALLMVLRAVVPDQPSEVPYVRQAADEVSENLQPTTLISPPAPSSERTPEPPVASQPPPKRVLTQSVPLTSSEPTACDQLAASPEDPDRVATAVSIKGLDIPAADQACMDAVAQYPNEGRFYYQLGRVAEAKQDWGGARKAYVKASSKGYRMGTYRLGMITIRDRSDRRNIRKGLGLIKEAAVAKLPIAQNAMGVYLANGKIVRRNMREALSWLKQSAMGGYPQGMHNLSRALLSPRSGKARSTQEAITWLRKAADRGVAEAQYDLGEYYSKGRYMPKDPKEAELWYSKAAEQGHKGAQKKLAAQF